MKTPTAPLGKRVRANLGDIRIPDHVKSGIYEAEKRGLFKATPYHSGKVWVALKRPAEFRDVMNFFFRLKDSDVEVFKGGVTLEVRWVLVPGDHKSMILFLQKSGLVRYD